LRNGRREVRICEGVEQQENTEERGDERVEEEGMEEWKTERREGKGRD